MLIYIHNSDPEMTSQIQLSEPKFFELTDALDKNKKRIDLRRGGKR